MGKKKKQEKTEKQEKLKKNKLKEKKKKSLKKQEKAHVPELLYESEIVSVSEDQEEPVMGSDEAAEILRAIGDESRMKILKLLDENELCAADLLKSLSIVQSTLSHHMKILTESGIVNCRKQGKWSYYTINRATLARAGRFLMKWSGEDGQDQIL